MDAVQQPVSSHASEVVKSGRVGEDGEGEGEGERGKVLTKKLREGIMRVKHS